MVYGGKINICAKCDQEILGRDEVQKIVEGREPLYLERKHMQWRTYMCGSAYMYSQVGGVTGSRGETKHVVCGCNAVVAETPSMTMVRAEFRDHVRALFGDALSVPLLFSIPTAMVAWENCGIVSAASSENGLVLSDSGMVLIEMIADMSRLGLFDGTVVKFREQDVLAGFSYLHMVKPAYRSFVAMDFGARATLLDLFAKVPMGWFDWEQMLTLRCEPADDSGHFEVSRVIGVPLVGEAFGALLGAGVGKAARAVCNNTSVSSANTCVQFLPYNDVHALDKELNLFVPGVGEASEVLLTKGRAFIPAGPVILSGYHLAVTFEPGVSVRTCSGTVITAPKGGVTIFLDGMINVELLVRKTDTWLHGGSGVPPVGRAAMSLVSVTCDSYFPGTALGAWHAKRFDVYSTTARFFGTDTEFVLLSCPAADFRDAIEPVWEHGRFPTNDGIVTAKMEVSEMRLLNKLWIKERECSVTSLVEEGCGVAAILNGVIEYDQFVSVGLLADAVVTFRAKPNAVVTIPEDFTFGFSATCSVAVDSYIIDRGGPSDSDGEFGNETHTAVQSVASGVLFAQAIKLGRLDSEHKLAFKAVWPDPEFGLSYSVIGAHPEDLAHALGMTPHFHELLQTPVSMVSESEDVFRETGWKCVDDTWQLVTGDCDVTWQQLAASAVSWFSDSELQDCLAGKLVRMYGITTTKVIRVPSVCY